MPMFPVKEEIDYERIDKIRLEQFQGSKDGNEADFIKIINSYSWFLQEGDFEYWQPYCYRNDIDANEWQSKFIESQNLEIDYNSLISPKIQQYRIMWIKNRFNEYLGPEWVKLDREIVEFGKTISYDEKWGNHWE